MRQEFIDVTKLTPAEKLQLVSDLWDDLAQSGDDIPVTDRQRAELDRRKQAALDHPEAGEPWEIVRERLYGGEA